MANPALVVSALAGCILAVPSPVASAADRAVADAVEVFACEFGGELPRQLRLIGGAWELRDGRLAQTGAALDDPCKAVIVLGENEGWSTGMEVTAKLRLDAWEDSDWARAGVSLSTDPQSGHGLNLVLNRGRLAFVHDWVAWGPHCDFACEPSVWYWMRLRRVGGELLGKAWRDGDPEPAGWMLSWREFDARTIGDPALVGCSGNPAAGPSAVSFARCRVAAVGALPPSCYARRPTWQETVAASARAVAAHEAELAAAERTPTAAWSPWHVIGPFRAEGVGSFAEVFPPERCVDTAAGCGDLRWTVRPEWVDGVVHYDLPVGDDIAVYLFRTVTVSEPATMECWLGSDDGMAVWLNGTRILSRDVARSAAPNQDRATLDLREGKNELLIKVHDHSGPSGFYFSTSPTPGPGAGDPRLAGLWKLLERDFPSARARGEMAREREDEIWSRGWPSVTVRDLAARYAAATRAGLAERARALAAAANEDVDLEPLRGLYHRSREIDEVLARWKPSSLPSLRLAVEDLTATFGPRYPGGPAYLRRLDELEGALAAAGEAGGRPEDSERACDAVRRFEELSAEALLANPLLDFDRLLVVKRRDSREMKAKPAIRGDAGLFSGNDTIGFLNGLPINFQGNGILREVPFDNEIAVLSPARPGGRLETLYRPERPVYVGDVDPSFEGDRLLFSSIGSHDRWQIFEIGVDGRSLRQVTLGEEPDVDAYDACYLPDGRILFASSSCFQSVPCERRCDEVANLCSIEPDGSGIRRLCFDQDHDFYPSVMGDGRVLYTRWEYTDIAHAFTGRLMTMNPDGTLQRAHYATGSFWPNRIFYARATPGNPSQFVGIVSGHHGTARAGDLVVFDVAAGRRLAEGAVQRIPGRGNPVEATMVDNLVDGSWPKFLHPWPLSDKYFLASCQPTSRSRWGVYLVDVFDNMLLLREEEGWVLFEPVPVRKTPRPPAIPDRTQPGAREATVHLLDVHAGSGLAGVPRGTVKRLRLFTYHFNYYGTSGIEDYVGMDGPWDVRRVLGTVPVQPDGSAYFTVPANTPIAVQPLDSEGKALQLMRSWFTAMPGESVSCVGCHESTNDAPRNGPTAAPAGEPSRIEPWLGPVRGFSWDREVQPVLDRFCVGCHDGAAREDGLSPPDLRRAEPASMPLSPFPFPPSYYALRRFVRSPGLEGPSVIPVGDYHADTSPLVQMLRKGHHGVRLDDEGWDRLVTWIDMNAPAYGAWLEIPTVRDRARYLERPTEYFSAWLKPSPVSEIEGYRRRRMELLLRYGGIEDDPEAQPSVPPPEATPVPPRSDPVPAEAVAIDGWPFDAAEAERRQSGEGGPTRVRVEVGGGIALDLVRVPAGELVMGDGAEYWDERPRHRVRIERPFWIGATEVTNAQYLAFDPSHSSGVEPMLWLKWHPGHLPSLDDPLQPVCRVSWDQAVAFCEWLSRTTGRRFALPTEAQWEWACRAGSDAPWSSGPLAAGLTAFANLADASLLGLGALASMEKVRPFFPVEDGDDRSMVSAAVGSYRPNRWGLHDMHGNVAEWTASAWVPYPFRADDPRHAASDERRTVRGGSWYRRAELARSGCRLSYRPWQRVFDVGFRVACESE